MTSEDRIATTRSAWGMSSRVTEREWVTRASCRGHDPEMWYPSRSGPNNSREAQRICTQCPVRFECRADADDRDEPFGIWGGHPRKGTSLHHNWTPQNPQPADEEAPGVFSSSQCMRCGQHWMHNAGPREHFSGVTKFCPQCIALMPVEPWGLVR